jgi:membrane protease YdiL (CAAX protease family)
VDYGPHILAQRAPRLDYPLTAGNVIGWLGFQGLYVGPTEEVLYRSLLVTYLTVRMPGKLRAGRYEMNGAGVVVAAIFALAHIESFGNEWWVVAFGQQLYAFALGVLYAYWLEKSKSVLAPVVGHNVSDLTEYVLLFLMVAAWG